MDVRMIDHATLLKLLHYDPDTGIFTWRERSIRPEFARFDRAWNTRYAGTEAGNVWDSGRSTIYRQIGVLGRPYYAHRLAVFYMTGVWPTLGVDHKDHDGLNNKWLNLRPANKSQNAANSRVSLRSSTGFKGVSFLKRTRRHYAQIHVHGNAVHLGYFSTASEAARAYDAAAKKHFREFASPNFQEEHQP